MSLNTNKFLLLKSLIDSDFLFLDQTSKKQFRSLKSLSRVDSLTIKSLDPLEVIKSVKQFIRILQFLKKQQKSFLHLWIENKQHLDLVDSFLKSSNLSIPTSIKVTLSKESIPFDVTQMLLVLNQPLNNNKTLFKRLFDKNIFIVNKVNSRLEKNNWGTYKIYNDLNDFKKIIFLLVILDQILTNKH